MFLALLQFAVQIQGPAVVVHTRQMRIDGPQVVHAAKLDTRSVHRRCVRRRELKVLCTLHAGIAVGDSLVVQILIAKWCNHTTLTTRATWPSLSNWATWNALLSAGSSRRGDAALLRGRRREVIQHGLRWLLWVQHVGVAVVADVVVAAAIAGAAVAVGIIAVAVAAGIGCIRMDKPGGLAGQPVAIGKLQLSRFALH